MTTENINTLPNNTNNLNDEIEVNSYRSNSTNFLTIDEFNESMDNMKKHILNEILKSIKTDKESKFNEKKEEQNLVSGLNTLNTNTIQENSNQIEKMDSNDGEYNYIQDNILAMNTSNNQNNVNDNTCQLNNNMKVFCNCGNELTCKFEREQGLCEDCCVK
jgi:hypothetical protein